MARRPSGCGMAVVLLLAAAAVLSTSALASESEEETTTTTTTTTSAQQQAPPPPPPSSSGSDDDDGDQQKEEQEMDPEMQKQKEKERQAAKEKAVEVEKEAQQQLLRIAQAKHLVSYTNGKGSYKGIAREFVNAHNDVRKRYGVTPLKWDKKLARKARRWSNENRQACQLAHNSHHKYGQNVYISRNNWNDTAKVAVDKWIEEEAIYDKQRNQCIGGRAFKDCGHFALMVNKKNVRVGCARAECFQGGVFVTCNYLYDDKDKDKKSKSN